MDQLLHAGPVRLTLVVLGLLGAILMTGCAGNPPVYVDPWSLPQAPDVSAPAWPQPVFCTPSWFGSLVCD